MRKRLQAYLSLLCTILLACGDDSVNSDQLTVIQYSPEAVSKTKTIKVYVHLMPWFETKETNNGQWGWHWTMATKNPEVVINTATGKREIASYYYPIIGPYASSDRDVIEYQLLLMKLSGIDGVLIDWYGTQNFFDYPLLLRNTEAIVDLTYKVGLEYAMVYEDQVNNNVSGDKIAAAKSDMNYLATKHFVQKNYIKVDGKPLLLTFGPQTFNSPSDWTSIFSGLSTKPKFLTLWYESGKAGTNASGEYSWVYQDAQSHLTHLDGFYDRSLSGIKMVSAYPGFKDFYAEGGWGSGYFFIDHHGTETFTTTLNRAIANNAQYLQLVTWNDYGEGTMIEPTDEFQYSFLTTLQSTLGVPYKQEDLELVGNLYTLRKKFTDDTNQRKLNQVFYYMVSLQIEKARDLIATVK